MRKGLRFALQEWALRPVVSHNAKRSSTVLPCENLCSRFAYSRTSPCRVMLAGPPVHELRTPLSACASQIHVSASQRNCLRNRAASSSFRQTRECAFDSSHSAIYEKSGAGFTGEKMARNSAQKHVPGPTRVLLHTRGRPRRVYAQFRLGVRGAEAASKPARPRGSVRGRQLPRAPPQLRCADCAAEKRPGVDRFLIHGSQKLYAKSTNVAKTPTPRPGPPLTLTRVGSVRHTTREAKNVPLKVLPASQTESDKNRGAICKSFRA